jgi:CubicO group peptidase (beta-lactamase class C family)
MNTLNRSAKKIVLRADGQARLQTAVETMLDTRQLHAIALRVHHGDDELLRVNAGHLDVAGQRPLPDDAIFRWFSLTKPVTSALLFKLFEEGRWALEDPLAKHLPELGDLQVCAGWDVQGRPICRPARRQPTMRDLMLHAAGFAYGIGGEPEDALDSLYRQRRVFGFSTTPERLLAALAELPLIADPGVRFHYSVAHDLQGIIAARLGGMSLGDAMRAKIFDALGMIDAGFQIPRQSAQRLVELAAHDDTGQLISEIRDPFAFDPMKPPSIESGGGGLLGTIDDCARFGRALINNGSYRDRRVLHASTVASMLAPQPLELPAEMGDVVSYSLGGVAVQCEQPAAGSPVGADRFFAAGAASCFMIGDRTRGVLITGMTQVLDWRAGVSPEYQIEALVYDALADG